MVKEPLVSSFPYKTCSDNDLIGYALFIIASNNMLSNKPCIDDDTDSLILLELEHRIIKASVHFGLPKELVFEYIQPTLLNYINFLQIFACEGEEEGIVALKNLIKHSSRFFDNKTFCLAIDNQANVNDIIKDQNQILIHQYMLFLQDEKQREFMIIGIIRSSKINDQSIWIINEYIYSIGGHDRWRRYYETPPLYRSRLEVPQIITAQEIRPEVKVYCEIYLLSNNIPRPSVALELNALIKFVSQFSMHSSDKKDRSRTLNHKLPLILKNTLRGHPDKFTKLLSMDFSNIRSWDVCLQIMSYMTYDEYKALSEYESERKQILNDYNDILENYFFLNKKAMLSSSDRWNKLRALYNLLPVNNIVQLINRYTNDIQLADQLLSEFADTEFVCFIQSFRKFAYSINFFESHYYDDEIYEASRASDYQKIYALYLEDKEVPKRLALALQAAASSPYLIQGDGYHKVDCSHYKAYIFLMTCKKAFCKINSYVELLSLFNYSLLKHLFIFIINRKKEYKSLLDKRENLIVLSRLFNRMNGMVIDCILYKHDSEIQKYFAKFEPDDALSESYSYAFDGIFKLLVNKIKCFLNNQEFLGALVAVNNLNILDLLCYKFNFQQLAALAEIKYTYGSHQVLSLLNVLLHPDMIKWFVMYTYEEIQQKTQDLFSAYSIILVGNSSVSQPSPNSSLGSAIANNPHSMFAKRPATEEDSLSSVSSDEVSRVHECKSLKMAKKGDKLYSSEEEGVQKEKSLTPKPS